MKLDRIRAVLESNICVDDGDCFYDCDTCNRARKTLNKYADAEKQGLLIKLPCKVGDTVYESNNARKIVSEYEIQEVIINKYGVSFFRWGLLDGIYSNLEGFPIECLGETVFLTKKEAEEALVRLTKI